MAARAAIPATVIADVLVMSRRRCCVCFALSNNTEVKAGQVAHLDRDASNSARDNLVFLCFDHHDQYDTRTSQSKGLTLQEVRRYRNQLYLHIERLLPLPSSDVAAAVQDRPARPDLRKSDPLPLFRRIEAVVGQIDRLNEGRIEIVSVTDDWPTWRPLRAPRSSWSGFRYVRYPTGDPDLDERALIAAGFNPPPFFSEARNETIALFCEFRDGFKMLEYYPIKYRTKLALIEEEIPHATLSGGTLALAADGRTLYVHERTASTKVVHEAHGRRHTFCGSARVGCDEAYRDTDMSLRAACRRETQEESGESPVLVGGKVAIVRWTQRMNHGSRSVTHAGIDAVYLGATIPTTADLRTRERCAGSADAAQWEGIVAELPIHREALVREFTTNHENWFPTGIAHNLIWLAIGAPNACAEVRDDSCGILVEILDRLDARS